MDAEKTKSEKRKSREEEGKPKEKAPVNRREGSRGKYAATNDLKLD